MNLKDRKQRSPLLHAIESPGENSDVVLQLLKKGADVNAVSIDGWSPLLKATAKQYHEILQKLLEQGANVGQKVLANHSALHIACDNGDLDSVKILIKYGATLDIQNRDKETPMMIAQKHMNKGPQYQELFKYLKAAWEEKEKIAKQYNDELVKQEELQEQREKKKKKKNNDGKYTSFKEEDFKATQEEDEKKEAYKLENIEPHSITNMLSVELLGHQPIIESQKDS